MISVIKAKLYRIREGMVNFWTEYRRHVDFSRFSRRAFPFSGRTNSEAATGLNLAG